MVANRNGTSLSLSQSPLLITGECRTIPECTEDELEDFPRRMREWLFNVMRELAERDELTPHYKELEQEAQVRRQGRQDLFYRRVPGQQFTEWPKK